VYGQGAMRQRITPVNMVWRAMAALSPAIMYSCILIPLSYTTWQSVLTEQMRRENCGGP
jgi:hypothetical protein